MGRSQQVPQGPVPDGVAGPDVDDTGCGMLHVDMDAFFASVEIRDNPALRGKAVVVGGVGPRGVVSSASYEARKFGVRSAMPTSRARRLCPHAVFVAPNFAAYTESSRAVMRIFQDVTPLVEPLSLDEAFLDVTGATRLLGPPAAIARQIRARVHAEQRITCSVGVASTKFMAKLASTRAKPDGLLVVAADRALEFLHPLPIEALWGVGERSAENLRRLGLRTVGDVAHAPLSALRHAVGDAGATHLHELSWGRDPRPVSPDRVDKSIGAETTFDTDVADPETIKRTLLALSGKVAERVRAAGHAGRTVALKVRLADFRTLSRSRTLATPTDVAKDLFDTAWSLYVALRPGDRIRLVGVRLENLVDGDQAARQPVLGSREIGWREAERAADAAGARFGSGVVRPASLLGSAGVRGGRDAKERTHDPLSDPERPS